ncbi:hypothetical protein I308_100082 [Cryptococcus tetragattii IND107]|uniref:Uncharacterized protein n=1 Tax=Cryptococcus tetragattii IND107 TaxID=1296105 RepID=A0ABR3C539_9TREE
MKHLNCTVIPTYVASCLGGPDFHNESGVEFTYKIIPSNLSGSCARGPPGFLNQITWIQSNSAKSPTKSSNEWSFDFGTPSSSFTSLSEAKKERPKQFATKHSHPWHLTSGDLSSRSQLSAILRYRLTAYCLALTSHVYYYCMRIRRPYQQQ